MKFHGAFGDLKLEATGTAKGGSVGGADIEHAVEDLNRGVFLRIRDIFFERNAAHRECAGRLNRIHGKPAGPREVFSGLRSGCERVGTFLVLAGGEFRQTNVDWRDGRDERNSSPAVQQTNESAFQVQLFDEDSGQLCRRLGCARCGDGRRNEVGEIEDAIGFTGDLNLKIGQSHFVKVESCMKNGGELKVDVEGVEAGEPCSVRFGQSESTNG